MKIYKTIEHDKYRVTVEKTDRGDYLAAFWDKNWTHESDRDIYLYQTLAEAYEKALEIVAEENILKVYNHGLN
jgi:hypothetical protein